MEKSEAVRRFNEGKHFVETCLEQIASLDQSNDKELRKALMGTFMVNVSYKAAENFGKVGSYVIDGKDGAQQLKDKLFGLKEKLVQLYNGADRQNLVTIKTISEAIISEIKEVEEWAGDEHFIHNPIPETGENGYLSTGNNSEGEDSGDEVPDDEWNNDDEDSDNEYRTLPTDMEGIFNSWEEYNNFIKDCESLCKPIQIVSRLLDCSISLGKPNTQILHGHLKSIGLIHVGYSQFCRLIKKELKA